MLYECHITLNAAHAEIGTSIAAIRKWKTSQIARDPVLGDDTFFYLTTYRDSMYDMVTEMRETANECISAGAQVLRTKIELIVYDSKTNKDLSLIMDRLEDIVRYADTAK